MKNLKNLGQALSKAEQRSINGGSRCIHDSQCSPSECTFSGDFNYIAVCRKGSCYLDLC